MKIAITFDVATSDIKEMAATCGLPSPKTASDYNKIARSWIQMTVMADIESIRGEMEYQAQEFVP